MPILLKNDKRPDMYVPVGVILNNHMIIGAYKGARGFGKILYCCMDCGQRSEGRAERFAEPPQKACECPDPLIKTPLWWKGMILTYMQGGKRFNRATVLGKSTKRWWAMRCDCGETYHIEKRRIADGHVRMCCEKCQPGGFLGSSILTMKKTERLWSAKGNQFGRITTLGITPKTKIDFTIIDRSWYPTGYWPFRPQYCTAQCECGKTILSLARVMASFGITQCPDCNMKEYNPRQNQ